MIARLCGKIVVNEADHIVLDVQGVGYLVHLPVGCAGRLKPDTDGRVTLIIHTVVREDALQLYGFDSPRQKLFFNRLTSVSGVGPRTAMSVLSTLTVDEAVTAVASENAKAFTKVSGIGKKTAERLLLELRGIVDELGISQAADRHDSNLAAGMADDLRSALTNLGYKPSQIEEALENMAVDPDESQSIDRLIREALRVL